MLVFCAGPACFAIACGTFELSGDDNTTGFVWIAAQVVCGWCCGRWSPRLALLKAALVVAMQIVLFVSRAWMAGAGSVPDRSTGGAAGVCIMVALLLCAAPFPLAAAAIGRTQAQRRSHAD